MDETLFDQNPQQSQKLLKLATIKTVTVNGATVQFEGEDESNNVVYGVAQSYFPVVGDRVGMLAYSGTYIILDSIGAPKATGSYIPLSDKGASGGVATLNSSGKVVQTAINADSATTAHTFSERHVGYNLGFFNGGMNSHQGVSTLSTATTSLPTIIGRLNTLITALKSYNLV